MECFDELLNQAEARLRNSIAQASAECRRAIAAKFVQATWRLNEAEAEVHAAFFDERWQWLPMPYGCRRNGRRDARGVVYIEKHPIEHRGRTEDKQPYPYA